MRSVIWSHEIGPSGAPLVVLVHGAMDRSAAMVLLSRRLDEQYRVLRYDRRGYARSHDAGGPFTIDAHVADLVALLDGRRAVVFGHSYGGNVALALAERHPQLVRAVAVYEVPLSWLPWWPGQHRTAQRKGRESGGCRRAVHASDGRRRPMGCAPRVDPRGPAGRGLGVRRRDRRSRSPSHRGTPSGSTCRSWRCTDR